MHLEVLFRAGWLLINTFGDPGTQGLGVTGMQGAGVRTPIAADVAAATAGFVGVVHMMKGIIFAIGLLSMMVAAGCFEAFTMLAGITVIVLGPVPKEHWSVAPLLTS
jgi:hypothetical protein